MLTQHRRRVRFSLLPFLPFFNLFFFGTKLHLGSTHFRASCAMSAVSKLGQNEYEIYFTEGKNGEFTFFDKWLLMQDCCST